MRARVVVDGSDCDIKKDHQSTYGRRNIQSDSCASSSRTSNRAKFKIKEGLIAESIRSQVLFSGHVGDLPSSNPDRSNRNFNNGREREILLSNDPYSTLQHMHLLHATLVPTTRTCTCVED